MQDLPSRIVKQRLFALAAIGSVLFSVSAIAADDPGVAPPAVKKPDVTPAEKSNDEAVVKSAEKPDEKPKRITQSRDGAVQLSARDATVHGGKLRYEPQKNTLGYWFNAADWVSWNFEITHPAKLFVDLTQSCGPDSAGSHYTVSVGDQVLKDKVQDTGSFRVYRLRRIGTMQFDKPGMYTLAVRVLDMPQKGVMDLRAITLMPPKPEKRGPPIPGGPNPVVPTPAAPTPAAPTPAAPTPAAPTPAQPKS